MLWLIIIHFWVSVAEVKTTVMIVDWDVKNSIFHLDNTHHVVDFSLQSQSDQLHLRCTDKEREYVIHRSCVEMATLIP